MMMAKSIVRLLEADDELHTIKFGGPSIPDETYHDVRAEDVSLISENTIAVKRVWRNTGKPCTIFINLDMVTYFTVV